MEYLADVWKVVGGASNGGIKVRRGREMSSPEDALRLCTGAKIRVLEQCNGRMRFELISGKGPQMGWVTSTFQGKELVVKLLENMPEKVQDDDDELVAGILDLRIADTQNADEYGEPLKEEDIVKEHLNVLEHFIAEGSGEKHAGENVLSDCMKAFDQLVTEDCQDAIQKYSKRLGEQNCKEFIGAVSKKAFSSNNVEDLDLYKCVPRSVVCAEFVEDVGMKFDSDETTSYEEPLAAEDFFQDDVPRCMMCNLPTGDIVYDCGDGAVMHGECVAQVTVYRLRVEDEARRQEDSEVKRERHTEYGVGWNVDNIPRNAGPAGKLAMREVPQGMVCLVLEESSRSVHIASTVEPVAAINLEYLSLALEVRRREGHEPVFSLDPGSAANAHMMQEKVLVPEWLAGTSVGDVLFQADYHLKELSMGEYEQPVVGMKSCFDYWDLEDDCKDWNAREWFLVRKAEVCLLDGGVLIPYVKMGVEARELLLKGLSLQDQPLTRPDHPMVKYAETFTRNFDLIAERKSVIYHLRELAKASVLAKHLLVAQVDLEEAWFHLATNLELPWSLEVPQLWNERAHSKIQLRDGAIVNDTTGEATRAHGVYGGVQFGLDKFNLSQRAPPPVSLSLHMRQAPAHPIPAASHVRRVPAHLAALAELPTQTHMPMDLPSSMRQAASAAVSKPPFPAALSEIRHDIVDRKALMATGLSSSAPPSTRPTFAQALTRITQGAAKPTPTPKPSVAVSVAPGPLGEAPPLRRAAFLTPAIQARLADQVPVARIPVLAKQAPIGLQINDRLQGVDLRLDSFDVTSAKHVSLETRMVTSDYVQTLDECTSIGDAFWACIEHDSEVFQEEDRSLFKEVFNPALSDRRQEGNCFTPPDVSYSYIMKLRALVKEEYLIRQQRKQCFFDKQFAMSEPGPLFPSSWTPSFEIARGRIPVRVPEGQPPGVLQPRPEYNKGHVATLLSYILKVSAPVFDRSTEEGLRFRIYRIGSLEVRTTHELGTLEEIGAVFSIGARTGGTECRSGKRMKDEEEFSKVTEYVEASLEASSCELQCRYYLVLEAQGGHKVVTERMRDGSVTWEEDPRDLEDRCSLAKVTRFADCCQGLTVHELLLYHASACQQAEAAGSGSVSAVECRKYAQATFDAVRVQEEQVHLPPLHEVVHEMRLSLQAQHEMRLGSTVEAEAQGTFTKTIDDAKLQEDEEKAWLNAAVEGEAPGSFVTFADDAELAD